MKAVRLCFVLISFIPLLAKAHEEPKVKPDKDAETLARMICKNQFLEAAVEKKYRPVFQKLTLANAKTEDVCAKQASETYMNCMTKTYVMASRYEKTKMTSKFDELAKNGSAFCSSLTNLSAAEIIAAILTDAVDKKITIDESAKQFAEFSKSAK